MTIYFGTSFDDSFLPVSNQSVFGTDYYGPQKLVNYLAILSGLPKSPSGADYLRLEQYRQALKQYIDQSEKPPFFLKSFQANQFAVSNDLLKRRDELLLAGWDFEPASGIPERIRVLQEVEKLFKAGKWKKHRFWCYEERLAYLLEQLPHVALDLDTIYLTEPMEFLTVAIRKLLAIIADKGVNIVPLKTKLSAPLGSDLFQFQSILSGDQDTSPPYQADGSLLILSGPNEPLLARYIAKVVKDNPAYDPVLLLGNQCNALDGAFIQEGLPALGIETSSYAKPSIQILKLATIFLWKLIDPYKLLEFVTLPIKPLPRELALRLADHIMQQPGVKGDRWYAMVNQYFQELEDLESEELKDARFQYNFWFERGASSMDAGAPKQRVMEIFEFLENWAIGLYRDGGELDVNMLNLSIQAGNIKELLMAAPEERFNPLEIEGIVKAIHEPGRSKILEAQQGNLRHVCHPDAIIQATDNILWWNFVQSDPTYFFSKWYQEEINFLEKTEVFLDSPKRENHLLNWKRKQPFLKAKRQLILCIPEKYGGKPIEPHSYLGNLRASLKGIQAFNISSTEDQQRLARFFKQPATQEILPKPRPGIQPFLQIKEPISVTPEDKEVSPTSLEDLFYFPYKWFFRHYCKIRPSTIQSIVELPTLFGNLAHRLMEKLLVEFERSWTKADVEEWIEQQTKQLLQQEGSILLMYGSEAERVNFINRIKFASWTLISALGKNNWEVFATESTLKGHFNNLPIKGRVDLVLKKGEQYAILDLKWKGLTYRKNLLRNEEDLQLVFYSKLLSDTHRINWPNSGFYIMEKASILSRGSQAFKEAVGINEKESEQEVHQRIYQRMQKTLDWRKQQLNKGWIEIRRKETIEQLQDIYQQDNVLELLEMKNENAPFDDYGILIGAIQ